MSIPTNLLYSKDHEWVEKENNQYRIGMTTFAQEELGDIVFVELPEVGDEVKAGEPFGSVESVKTVSELYSPIAGKIVEVNEALEDAPELVNESPFEKAWMIVVESDEEPKELLSPEQYEKLTAGL